MRTARVVLGALARLSPDLAGRAAVRLFRTVRQHRVPERERLWAESAEPISYDDGPSYDGPSSDEGPVRLRALAWGSGPTVLMMHGWEGRASQMGAVGLALAEAGFRAVSVEAPGHGSDRKRVSSLWQFAGAVTELARREGPLAGFVGHSFGNAAICYAQLRGTVSLEEVERIVFVAPPGDLNDFFEMLFALLRLGPEVRAGFVRTMEAGLETSWDTARLCTRSAAVDRPLLILHDETDHDTPIAGAEAVQAAWPDSRLVRSSGLGHRRILRDAATLDRITTFLSGTDVRPGVAEAAASESGT